MIVLLVILIITFLFILGAGLVFLKCSARKSPLPEPIPGEHAQRQWKHRRLKSGCAGAYFLLPLAILLVSVILRFISTANCPRRWSGSSTPRIPPPSAAARLALWAIVPQALFDLAGLRHRLRRHQNRRPFQRGSASGIQLDSILLVMSNVVVIPQLILTFAMLRIFSYNSFQTDIEFCLVGFSRHHHASASFC